MQPKQVLELPASVRVLLVALVGVGMLSDIREPACLKLPSTDHPQAPALL